MAQAKFSVQELREMEKLPGVQLIINEDDFDLDDETIEVAGKDKLTRQMVEELFAIREMAEDMEDDGDEVRDRLYATGWAKRGPVGLIGSTKSDALAIVTNMLEDLAKAAEGGRVAADRDPESIDRLLAERGIRPIDFAGWKKVDAFERAEGAKEGREHKKVIEPDQMRELALA